MKKNGTELMNKLDLTASYVFRSGIKFTASYSQNYILFLCLPYQIITYYYLYQRHRDKACFNFLFTVFISLPTPLSNASLSEFETWALLCSYVLIHNY